MKVAIGINEHYPVYDLYVEGEEQYATTHVRRDVDEATAARWREAEEAYARMQREIKDLVNPPCPECGHPKSQHQEWSKQWGNWACLGWGGPCQQHCRHGIPAERAQQLQEAGRW